MVDITKLKERLKESLIRYDLGMRRDSWPDPDSGCNCDASMVPDNRGDYVQFDHLMEMIDLIEKEQ